MTLMPSESQIHPYRKGGKHYNNTARTYKRIGNTNGHLTGLFLKYSILDAQTCPFKQVKSNSPW